MWFKVDDTLAFHHKVVAAGNPAMGLWVRAGAWSSQMLTDGHIPTHMVAALGRVEDAERLTDVGLWDASDDGYRFHGWDEFQFTREEVEAKRAIEREKKRKQRAAGTAAASESRGDDGRFAKASPVESRGDTPRESRGVSPATRPVPSRPDQSPTDSSAAAAAGFDTFWAKYPKKDGKGAAVKAWKAATKKADATKILTALDAHVAGWVAENKERKFIPNPTTWLNQERWDDEVVAPTRPNPNIPEGWGTPLRAVSSEKWW